MPIHEFYSPDLIKSMCESAFSMHRQVGVILDRQGTVVYVIVGDSRKLYLPDLGRMRAGGGRLRGLRLLHTHLNQEGLTRDDLVDLVKLRLDLVAVLCLGPDGRPWTTQYAHNVPGTETPYFLSEKVPLTQFELDPFVLIGEVESRFAKDKNTKMLSSNGKGAKDGRAILVFVAEKHKAKDAETALGELAELARTAGVDVADTVMQVRPQVDPKFVLGRGKLDDVIIRALQMDAELLIFGQNLTPSQNTAISLATELKVIDRTQLILDIFAQRAESRDGKLQVELAQMKYLLPRLGQKDDALSRLTGGIGGRGPGETKLEIGKRRARDRISHLETQLEKLETQRVQRRKRRGRANMPIVSIVGYTNAGKSTLLNALTQSETIAENKLFATLDTRSRRLRFPQEREVVITDTVGFIRELPKDLFAAFKATFEETADADLILHVIDASDPSLPMHIETTVDLLRQLSLEDIPRLLVMNKMDKVHEQDQAVLVREISSDVGEPEFVSALDKQSLIKLLDRIARILEPKFTEMKQPDYLITEVQEEQDSHENVMGVDLSSSEPQP